ncbi:MAG: DUF2877 domain-containing protein [Defluviicoccus sp.]|nr:DUF2877 domain-containing protein [Defluviicoccus sp.]MDE0383201.1 DUF2877 domain-containing protein [Defluviicoccus sp.]
MGEPPIRLGLIGCDAARCLRALGRDGGSVLAAFRRSVYLEHDSSGAIACVGPPALGAGPLNALAGADQALPDWQDSGLAPGDPVAPEGDGIGIAGRRALTFRDARLHDPLRGPLSWTKDGLAKALARLSEMLAPFALADGLAPLADPARRAAPPASPLTERARPAIAALESGLAAGTPPPREAVERLVGLGPGLTPSGDDFLGGMTIALAMSGRAEAAAALAVPVLEAAPASTNRISAAHLGAAARGFGADALHRALDAMARGDDRALAAALRGLDAIGHSSGWDAMAGAVSALRVLAAQPATSAAAVSAAPALDSATTMPASRSAAT